MNVIQLITLFQTKVKEMGYSEAREWLYNLGYNKSVTMVTSACVDSQGELKALVQDDRL